METVSQQVHRIADQLPLDASWDEVLYQVQLRASIERGLDDLKHGRSISVENLMAEFGIAE